MTESETKTTGEEVTAQSEQVQFSPNEAAIIRQLEYYFGDANLLKDKFLKEQIKLDDGWVPLDVLLTFKRLKALSEDKKVISDAIEKSTEGLVEVSEDREKLRRHPERPIPELDEETRKELYTRTVYVKGFAPQDGTNMNELVEFFQPYEKVTNIVMRKYHDKPTKKYLFKGSVFVTFVSTEQCEKFLAIDKLTYKGKELIRKMQNDYFVAKQAENKERAEKIEQRKRKKEEAQTLATAHLPTGASVFLEGLGSDTSRETSRETIKEAIKKVDDTLEFAFVDFKIGDKSGYVRFNQEGAGKRFVEKLTDKKIKIDDADVTVELLVDEKEAEYLKKVVQDQQARRKGGNAKGKGGRGHRGNNHKNYGGQKRKREDGEEDKAGDEPPVKKVETPTESKEQTANNSDSKAE